MEHPNRDEGGQVPARDLLKLRMLIEAFAAHSGRSITDVRTRLGEPEARMANLSESTDELSRIRADRSLRERQIRQWEDTAVSIFDSIFRTLSYDLNPEFRAGVESIFENMKRALEPTGFRVIVPRAGDACDSRIHSIEERTDPDVWTIRACRSWGYQNGFGIIRPAGVLLGHPIPAPPREDESVGGETHMEPLTAAPIHRHTHRWIAATVGLFLLGYLLGRVPERDRQATLVSGPIPAVPTETLVLPTVTPEPTVAVASSDGDGDSIEPPGKTGGIQDWPLSRVRRGDTLWTLAARWYGDGRLYPLVMAANRLETECIVPGQELRFPGAYLDPSSAHDAAKETQDAR